MKSLTYKQLAYVLDIELIESVRKIIYVHCKIKGITPPVKSNLIRDYIYKDSEWPREMAIESLQEHLNLPDLQYAVNDIRENYLTRQASKKWILCDYPEKELKTKLTTQIKIPPVLASMLRDEDVNFIETEWNNRYGITF